MTHNRKIEERFRQRQRERIEKQEKDRLRHSKDYKLEQEGFKPDLR